MEEEQSEITVVCLSDTHAKEYKLFEQIPKGDILIHAGDFTRVGERKDVEEFNSFLGKLDFKYKIIIAGNHDLSFDSANYDQLKKSFAYPCLQKKENEPEQVKKLLTNCIYLEDQSCEVMGYKFYGSPWTPYFYGWGFNLQRGEEIQKIWAQIPTDTDILITHGPPYKILDWCQSGSNEGDKDLLNEIQNRVKPKYHIFGHIHESYGEFTDGTTQFINASNLNFSYQPVNKPIVFKLPVKKQI